MHQLVSYLKDQKAKIDGELEVFLDEQLEMVNQIDPILTEIITPSKNLFLSGGKRLRPILVHLGYELTGGSNDGLITRASLFAELIHSYILVHDDIADRDFLRYGKPTLQIEFENEFKQKFGKPNPHFGTSIAIVAGDLIQTLAHQAILSSGFNPQKIIEAEKLINYTLQEVVGGWYLHQIQNYQTLEEAKLERYLDGMKLVSSSYTIKSPLILGNLLSDNPLENTKVLETYAYHTGMAFQIQDDILGVFGDTKTTGKPAGNDLREGKKTALLLHAYNQSDDQIKDFLSTHTGVEINSDQLEKIKKIIKDSGSFEYSQNLAKEHIKQAKASLDTLPRSVNQESKQLLVQIADFVLQRNF